MRDALLDQISYLLDEIRMLRPQIESVPDEILAAHPVSNSRSLKELYGLIVATDIEMYERLSGSEGKASVADQQPWDELPVAEILNRLESSRRRLLATLESADGMQWRAGGAAREAAETVVRRDLEYQREIAERLSERRTRDA